MKIYKSHSEVSSKDLGTDVRVGDEEFYVDAEYIVGKEPFKYFVIPMLIGVCIAVAILFFGFLK